MSRGKRGSSFKSHLRAAYRSGLETAIAATLAASSVPYEFEPFRIPYTQPEKSRHYTPDFVLANGIIIETKGLFEAADRHKHLWIKEQHPDLDIRFVFSNANARLRKGSPTSYSMWAEVNGFLWAHRQIPTSWLTEPVEEGRTAAVEALRG